MGDIFAQEGVALGRKKSMEYLKQGKIILSLGWLHTVNSPGERAMETVKKKMKEIAQS